MIGWALKAKEMAQQVKVCSCRPDSLSLVSRAHGRRTHPEASPEPGPWHPDTTHTNNKLFLKVVRVSGNQYPCLHTYKYAHTRARQIHGNRDEEGREMGSWKAVEIQMYINAYRVSAVYS